jgi:UDP-N-acetylglucosamine/UDP-N-acetylgalactosamine diphosphorylase
MDEIPAALRNRLNACGQQHVLRGWDALTENERRDLIAQLERLDFELLADLYRGDKSIVLPSPERIEPVPVISAAALSPKTRALGQEALRRGEVAVLVVAGGQGSRLGFEHPKGIFPIGPVTNKSLFQIHAEKTLAVSRRYGRAIPFLVLTSPATHSETQDFFRDNNYFGLPRSEVFFCCQGTMPALDMSTGKLILERPGRIFTSPNGHGGMLAALVDSGILAALEERGVRELFYFQVDNPLVKIADCLFLDQHLQARAEASSKIVRKLDPDDKLGNLVVMDGRCTMIEYSDLPADLARQLDPAGGLRIWAGSPAIHCFSVNFLSRVAKARQALPFHVARKKVAYWDPKRGEVEPERENALKFEMFIFDILPLAERWTVVETERDEEFVPLKNAVGPDSPPVVRQAISNLAAKWLERTGARVPRNEKGDVAYPLEISPLFALDAEEFAARISESIRIDGPRYWS